LRGDYNVLSKNVTRDISQSEKTLSEVLCPTGISSANKGICFFYFSDKQPADE
jgi:16S rRNA G1207 methylase RsmC